MTDHLPKVARVRAQIEKLAKDIRDVRDGMPRKKKLLQPSTLTSSAKPRK